MNAAFAKLAEETGITRDIVAYHEAAHAVTAEIFWQGILKQIVLDCHDGNDQMVAHCVVAHCDLDVDKFPRGRDQDIAMVAMAGRQAELILGFDHPIPSSGDYELIDRLPSFIITFLEGRCRRLLERHWNDVFRIANALMDRGRLSGDEARQILQKGALKWRPSPSTNSPTHTSAVITARRMSTG